LVIIGTRNRVLVQHLSAAKWRSMFTTPESAMRRRPFLASQALVAGAAAFAPRLPFVSEGNGRRRISLCFTAWLVLINLAVYAQMGPEQNVQTTNRTLTLTGAVDLALKQNLDVQVANIETARKQQDLNTAMNQSCIGKHEAIE
jgi:hypothetical protein